MNLEIIQDGRPLRTYNHNGQIFAEAPESGEYELRLTNTSPNRRMAVLSVDGINVIDGKEAGVEGSGYVLNAWQTTTIKGFLRGSSECARFTFSASQGSYAALTGHGTKNTSVIGVAVFDEKAKPVMYQPPTIIVKEIHHHYDQPIYRGWPNNTAVMNSSQSSFDCTLNSNSNSDGVNDSLSFGVAGAAASSMGEGATTKGLVTNTTRRSAERSKSPAPDLGTAYGRAEAFHTSTTTFERASSAPVTMLTIRYGVREKLIEWGVPVTMVAPAAMLPPNPFPASTGYAQPPVGWRG